MFKIAIDGPAGAGKSTIAKAVALRLGIEYIDTGAMYRAITLKGLKLGIDLEDESSYSFLNDTVLDIENGRVILDGIDVSTEIRSVEVTENVSTPSKIGIVRTFLVEYQRNISNSKSVIMDGRDIGTVVLPNAELKIYLNASVECRALRRMKEREACGIVKSLEETMKEIDDRDRKDSTRKISPLKCAEDACVIDSSNLSIEEVVNTIIKLVYERGLIKMSKNYEVGQKVRGVITNVTSSAIYLEVGNEEQENIVKAVIYSNDLKDFQEGRQKLYNEYQEGADFAAHIKQIDKDTKNGEMLLILSTKLADMEAERQRKEDALNAKIEALKEVKANDEIFNAKVRRVTDRGVELTYNNTRVFLPYKLASVGKEGFEKLVGEEIPVLIAFINEERHQIIVSQTAAEKKCRRLNKEAAYNSLEVGSVCEGTVTTILPYGAIVSLGEVSGLLHISEIDHFQVKDINKVLTVGQKVTVKVIKMNEGKIGLSIKALSTHPWDVLKEKYHVGDVFNGTVKKIIPAGLIIELTDNYSGLMPKVEYSWVVTDRVENAVKEGDSIEVKVMNIDDEKHRVSLSHRETLDNAWGKLKLRKGDLIDVTIASATEKGAIVKYADVQGFLPVSEVSNTKRVSSVTDVYPVDSVVKVMVLDFESHRAKLLVSVKAVESKKERDTFESYMKEQAQEDTKSTFAELLQGLEVEEEN